MTRFRRGLLVILILSSLSSTLLSTGCVRRVSPAPEGVKNDASLEELLNLYYFRRDMIDGFKGLVKVSSNSPRRGSQSFLANWASQGEETRIQGFDFLGRTLFDLRLAGPSVSLSIPSERRVFEGGRDAFEEMAEKEIPLGSIGLIDWVGQAGIPALSDALLPALEKGDDFFILYLFKPGVGKGILDQKIWIERTKFWVKRVEGFDPTGARRSVLTLDDYRKVGTFYFPFDIRGESRGEEVALHFQEVNITPGGRF
ncbi:MAG TPA: hypothetical protein VI382_03865 [Candidatus Manganitrophaceae bacterium]|nr:hypothetical protein [Candidatus Manganitrophaceae bacterium]